MINPPTDKLYKFQAIAGCLLILFGLIYPVEKYSQASLYQIAFKEKINKFEKAALRHTHFVERRNTIISKFIVGDKLKNPMTDQEYLEFQQAKSQFMDSLNESDALGKEVDDALVESNKYEGLSEHYLREAKLWFNIGMVLMAFGFLIATLGFKRWGSQVE